MKVDRERFLLLAAALTACGTPPTGTMNEPAPMASAEPLAIAPIATARAEPVLYASAQPSASTAPEPEPPPIKAARPDPYKGSPVKAQTCDPAQNKIGTSPACKLSAPGPTCESFNDTKQECPQMNTLLKPRVAAAAINCLLSRSGTTDICEFNVTSICAYEALGSACLDPTAKAACDGVMKRCGGGPKSNYNKMSRDSCEAGVSGIADAKRKKFISCITESCRFETCLTYL